MAAPFRNERCSCGRTAVSCSPDGNADIRPDHVFPEWDMWSEDGDIVIVAAPLVDVAILRAMRDGRPFDAVLAVWKDRTRDKDEMPDYGTLRPEVVACADAENDLWPQAPQREHIDAVLSFGRRHAKQRILIHCYQGLGRSPAAALAIVADRLGSGREAEAVEHVLHLRPCALINRRMTGLADEALGREGRLVHAVSSHPLLRARFSAKRGDYGWHESPGLLMPGGGSQDLTQWQPKP